jgi:protein SCO1
MTKRRILSFILGSIALFALTACSSSGIPNAKNWKIEEFSFINQEEETVSTSDLKGKVWIADFIFTSCEDVCFPMTWNMSKLQKMLKDEGIKDVEFVSFSVDPEVDKPEVLKAYGNQFNVEYSNWHFLTGYKQKDIEQFARKSFKTIVVKPENEDQVTHGTDFYLVDQEGKIIQYYSGLEEIPFADIIQHIKILQKG